MVKLKPAARANVKGRRSADKERSRPAADAEAEPARAAGPRGGGVHKKKHLMGSKREHALLPRLREEDASGKAEALAAKQRRKRASNSGVLGAVSGMRATLDELLAAGEAKAAAAMAQSSVGLNAKKRLKLVAEETVRAVRPMALFAANNPTTSIRHRFRPARFLPLPDPFPFPVRRPT